jgi:hypothetical protein
MPRNDEHKRSVRQSIGFTEDVFPIAIRKVTLTYDDRWSGIGKEPGQISGTHAAKKIPMFILEDPAQT